MRPCLKNEQYFLAIFDYGVIVMYNTISIETSTMLNVSRRTRIPKADDRIVAYSALFMVCALMSAVGGGAWGALAFMPAAVAVEIASRSCADSSDNDATS